MGISIISGYFRLNSESSRQKVRFEWLWATFHRKMVENYPCTSLVTHVAAVSSQWYLSESVRVKSSSREERSLVSFLLCQSTSSENHSAFSVAGGHTSLHWCQSTIPGKQELRLPYSNDIIDGQVWTQPKIEEVAQKLILKYPFMKDDMGSRYVST